MSSENKREIRNKHKGNKTKIPKIYNFKTAIWTPPKDTRVKLGEPTFMKNVQESRKPPN